MSDDKPNVVYNADKARRVERVNEAHILVDAADLHRNYLTAPEAKSKLEEEAARQSDNIKYSRFAGVLFTETGGLLLYHFGKGNLHLNISGEKSVRAAAGRLYRQQGGRESIPRFSMLVLGSSTSTALEILDYSDMLADREKDRNGRLLKRHFNFKDFKKLYDDIMFLPITAESKEVLKILSPPGNGLYYSSKQYRQEERHLVNLLECRLHLWPHYRNQIPSDIPVDFLCYRWQEPLVQEYFINRKNVLDPCFRLISTDAAKDIVGLMP